MSLKYGYHAGIGLGYDVAIQNVLSMGGTAAQIWVGNNKSYNSKPIEDWKAQECNKIVDDTGFFLIAHSPYVLNFARPLQESEKGLKALGRYLADLENITKLGGVGSVLHMGSNVKEIGQTMEQAYATFVSNLGWIIDRKPTNAIIILENMAGGGTRMCCEMDEWGDFWENYVPESYKEHIRWCVDTAHLYSVGEYDLSRCTEVLAFERDFDDRIGLKYLLCFHFNGSKTKLGGCHDSHADITAESCGLIATKGMRQIAKVAAKHGVPIIMETPGDTSPVESQMAVIESWGL